MKKTQYEKIASTLKAVGRQGAGYRELMLRCGTNYPWKRIGEMEQHGYIFRRWQTKDARPRTMLALVSAPK